MKQRIALVVLFLVGMALTVDVRADDAEDVKAAYVRHITLSRTGQINSFVEQHFPGHTAFGPNGGLLTRNDSLEEEKKTRQAMFDRGRSDSTQPSFTSVANVLRHVEVQVYGTTAVLTGYLSGPVTLSDGSTRQGTRRVTAVWIKQGNEWKEVHDHMSTLLTSP
jgi:ketosteroid isomerase-like protein